MKLFIILYFLGWPVEVMDVSDYKPLDCALAAEAILDTYRSPAVITYLYPPETLHGYQAKPEVFKTDCVRKEKGDAAPMKYSATEVAPEAEQGE